MLKKIIQSVQATLFSRFTIPMPDGREWTVKVRSSDYNDCCFTLKNDWQIEGYITNRDQDLVCHAGSIGDIDLMINSDGPTIVVLGCFEMTRAFCCNSSTKKWRELKLRQFEYLRVRADRVEFKFKAGKEFSAQTNSENTHERQMIADLLLLLARDESNRIIEPLMMLAYEAVKIWHHNHTCNNKALKSSDGEIMSAIKMVMNDLRMRSLSTN